jgi:hypothetical protein
MNKHILFFFICLYSFNVQAQENNALNNLKVNFDQIKISSDTFLLGDSKFIIKIGKNYKTLIFPKVSDNGILVFVNSAGQLLHYTVTSFDYSVDANGSSITRHYSSCSLKNDYLIRGSNKTYIFNVAYVDESGNNHKNKINAFEITRIK